MVIFIAQSRVGELASQGRVITRSVRRRPPHGRTVFCARLTDSGASIQMHQRAKVLGALVHLIRRDVRELCELTAGLFARLAPHRVFR